MRRAVGVVLIVLGGLLTLVAIPFLVHTLVNVFYVLLLEQPVPGWWWGLVRPVQDIVALPILAFAFVIPLGHVMSLVAPLIVELFLLGLGLVLLWMGRRMVRRRTSTGRLEGFALRLSPKGRKTGRGGEQ